MLMKSQQNGAETIAALIIVGVFTVLGIDTVRSTAIPSDVLILLSNVAVAVTSWYFGVHATVTAATSTQQAAAAAVAAATDPQPQPAPTPEPAPAGAVHPQE